MKWGDFVYWALALIMLSLIVLWAPKSDQVFPDDNGTVAHLARTGSFVTK